MRKLIYIFFLFTFLLVSGLRAAEVVRLEIRGTINPATSQFFKRALQEAEKNKASLILMELDTPGGLVTSTREMAQSMDRSKIPVIVFTSPAGASATSAGALLVISSHLAAMAPGTNLGAAHPVALQSEEMKGAMADKAVNDISAFARSMAALRGRNAKAANEVVTKSNSYTADEALKENLIEIIVPDVNSLWKTIDQRIVIVGKEKIKLKTNPAPQVRTIEMNGGEKLLDTIAHPNIAAILMTLAILLIYAELSSPGLGFPGILGGLFLIVAFISFQALSIHIGGLILLSVGTLLIIAELFTSSGGLLAIGEGLALILGFLWGVNYGSDLKISFWVLGFIAAVLGGGILAITLGISRLKKRSEETLRKIGGGDLAGVRGYKGIIKSVNADHRSGTVLIRGELWNFISQKDVTLSDSVLVRKSNGLVLEVEPIVEKDKE